MRWAEILTHQRSSGGFGFWEDDDAAVPWLSAYAMLAVETAGKKGFFVPKESRDRGIAYLRGLLDGSKIAEEDGADAPIDSHAHDDEDDAASPGQEEAATAYATLTFVADVLASLGLPDPGYLEPALRCAHPPAALLASAPAPRDVDGEDAAPADWHPLQGGHLARARHRQLRLRRRLRRRLRGPARLLRAHRGPGAPRTRRRFAGPSSTPERRAGPTARTGPARPSRRRRMALDAGERLVTPRTG